MKLFVKHGIFLFATVLSLSTYSIMADEAVQSSTKSSVENMAKSTPNDVVVGNPNNAISNLKEDKNSGSSEPSITKIEVSGGVNPSATGVDFFKDVEINLEGNNLTDDNFLSKEGLHWSDKTYVEIDKGTENGLLNDSERFGEANTPSTPVVAYSNNVGDSGRINFVGKTLSGIDLDLLWTVIESDKDEWASNSGFQDSRPKGLGFSGEQFIPGATGNSIVVLYNNASNLALHYQIVKHGTKIEQPILVSFISTDIDAAQGVQTNLANLVEIIPTESNLVKEDGIIYDVTSGVVGLNGSKDLPKGGYLGAGFISNFDYTFYSPAPKRVNDSYYYPIAVRYDIFGSSLQANINTRVSKPIIVQYVDKQGKELRKAEFYKGFDDESYKVEFLNIPNYRLVDVKRLTENKARTRLQFVYQKELPVTLKFQDEKGKELYGTLTYKVLEGQRLKHTPRKVDGYVTPTVFETLVEHAVEKVFVYQKIPQAKENLQPSSKMTNPNVEKTIRPQLPSSFSSANSNHPVETSLAGGSLPSFSQGSNQVLTDQGQRVEDSHTEPKKQEIPTKKDPFLTNTKMNQDEKKLFLDYIRAVGDEARKKYGNDRDKINHAIANAIARVPYANDGLQSMTNDFGEAPDFLTSKIHYLLSDLHASPSYTIDFPHLAAPIATSYKSSSLKEKLKFFAGLSPFNLLGLSPKTLLFQNNSLTGDLLTTIDEKDTLTDIDAFILKYHRDFKDLDLDLAIEKYYHTDGLEQKRQEYYYQVLKEQSGDTTAEGYKDFLLLGSIFSLSGLALIGMKKFSEGKAFKKRLKEDPSVALREYIWNPLKSGVASFMKHPLKFIEEHITAPIGNTLATLGSAGLYVGAKIVKTVNDKLVKPVVSFLSTNVVKPLYNSVVKPVVDVAVNKVAKPLYQKIIKPVVKPIVNFAYNAVAKPFYHGVVKPAYNHVVKPIAKAIHNNVLKPVYNHVLKPVASFVNRTVVKPVYNYVVKPIVKPVYNHIVKPIVKPIYQKVVKPIARATNRYVIKPVVNIVKKWVVNPIKNWFGNRKGKRR